MDRGRMIDHIQNTNARMFDKFASNRTSVRLMNPPGGKSSIQLGWDYDDKPMAQPEKMRTPLQIKHMNQMSSNGVFNCFSGQGGNQRQPVNNRSNNKNYTSSPKHMKQPEPPMNSYCKTPDQTQQYSTNNYNYNRQSIQIPPEIREQNPMEEDYYPLHLAFSYENNQFKQPSTITTNQTSYEQFLNEHINRNQKFFGMNTQQTSNANYNNTNSFLSKNNSQTLKFNSNNIRENPRPLQQGAPNNVNNTKIDWDACFSRRKSAKFEQPMNNIY